MSQVDPNFLEEGRAGQLSREGRNGRNPASGQTREIQKKFSLGLKKVGLDFINKTLEPQGALGSLICLALIVIGTSLDPLFFYIPVVNNVKKCIRLDKKLGITASVVRSGFDFVYIIFSISRLRTDPFASFCFKCRNQQRRAWKHWLRFFLTDVLAILPIPQVVILIIFRIVRGSKFFYAMKFLKFLVFFQYLPRLIRIPPLFPRATITSSDNYAVWARAAFYLLLYLLAGHILGSFWYFLAIERETECWKRACKNHTGCVDSYFYCDDSLGDYTFLNDSCPTKTPNTTMFDFGIFHDALQSGIVEVTDFPQKFSYCFNWGLKSLSSFGQNLQTSSCVGENLFAIVITISGLVLFAHLIGNMQIYLQSKTALRSMREEERKVYVKRLLEAWAPFKKLPETLQSQVKKYLRQNTDGNIVVENLLNILPRQLNMEIKHELYFNRLKKVKNFKYLNEEMLDAVCDRVKEVYFNFRDKIVCEGNPINEMVFVVHGKLWTYTSKTRTANNPITNLLKDGDDCGKDLLIWALHKPLSSKPPVSTQTIQALTKVEAFAINANDLKEVFIKHHLYIPMGNSPRYSEWSSNPIITQAVVALQKAWRERHSKEIAKARQGKSEPGLQRIDNRSFVRELSTRKRVSAARA